MISIFFKQLVILNFNFLQQAETDTVCKLGEDGEMVCKLANEWEVQMASSSATRAYYPEGTLLSNSSLIILAIIIATFYVKFIEI